MNMKSTIEKKLTENFSPKFLEVKNKSHLHRGHLEDENGETHFEVVIEAEDLKKLGRIQAHREVNSVLKDEFEKGLHALEIKIK
ncbi:MAG: BolA/IbaG family iron-sulfur metabolism protein [Proteobacteria bacterium]|nr:BolA/IbaG family iron-sulfur metabolism protein [Pseudomonadota bacterium]